MKKLISLALCLTMVATVFTACGSGSKEVKTGLAVIASFNSSTADAGEKDGLAQTDSTAVAVLVDDKGVIKKIAIDAVQNKINFNTAGEITTDMKAEFASKKDLKEAYNMKGASPIGKEWYEQIAALEEYVTGKTIDQVKKIALNEKGYVTDADLTSSVTINIATIIDAIEKAVNNAENLGAKADDKLGLGVVSTLGSSANATDEKDGTAQAYSHFAAISFDKNGKITSSIIDANQGNVKFSKEGKITSDLKAEVKTKIELKEAYGMKGASGIGKEWYEQSKAFTDYIKGKTVDEVKSIALTDKGVPTAEDLVSSVTIKVKDFVTAVGRAGASAK